MTASSLISQLTSLVKRARDVEQKISKVSPRDAQWAEMADLSVDLVTAASCIQRGIQSHKALRSEQASKQSEAARQAAKPYQEALLNGNVRARRGAFRNNIVLVFKGPRILPSEPPALKNRKNITLERCLQLRSLHPKVILLWSVSYPASSWAGGEMADEVFNILIEKIEPSEQWSPTIMRPIMDELDTIKNEESLNSSEFNKFLQGLQNPPPYQGPSKKRKHHDSLLAVELNTDLVRDHQYVAFNFMRRDNVFELPQPIRTGVMASKRWNEEAKAGGRNVTNTVSMYIPAQTADGLFIARLRYREAWHLFHSLGLGEIEEPVFNQHSAIASQTEPMPSL